MERLSFDLISLFHVQIQESTGRSTVTREFVFLSKFAEFYKKKLMERLSFDLISLFHVQIQESTGRSATTREFVFLAKFAEYYYYKIFETKYP